MFPLKNIPYDFPRKVDNFDCTDDGEPSEKSHSATNCRQHVSKFCCAVLVNQQICWGMENYSHKSQLVFPFII